MDDDGNQIDGMEPWKWEEIRNKWYIDENKIIHEATYPWWDYEEEEWDYEDFEEEWTYDEGNGFLSLYQILDGGEILWEIATDILIPGYKLPILLGITAIFTVGLVCIIQKKCKIF